MRKLIIGFVVTLVLIFTAIPFTEAKAQDAGPLDHVIISPVTANITIGGTQLFIAVGQDSSNVTITSLSYTWAVANGGGSINSTGWFTAGNTTGTFTNTVNVTAVQGSITKTSFATVIITAAKVGKPPVPPGWSQGHKNGWKGSDIPPGWAHGKKTGWGNGDTPPGLSHNMPTPTNQNKGKSGNK